MSKTEYDPQVKAAAMAALLAGQSISSVAKEYSIPKGTVSGWNKQAHRQHDGVDANATQKAEIGDLLIDYLKGNLRALKKQTEVFGDAEWLKRQSADELAVLHGVSTDKAIRLLEALAESGEGESGRD